MKNNGKNTSQYISGIYKAIFSGIKTAEFRRKVVNELLEGGIHTLYFYETKKNGGAGKIVGQADVKEVLVTLQAVYMPSGLPQLDGPFS